VPASVDFVEVREVVGVGKLDPAARGSKDLAGELRYIEKTERLYYYMSIRKDISYHLIIA
jgi:hypothetical protein